MTILNVLKNDLRLIRRDMILIALLVFVVYLGVTLRFLLPWADGYLAAQGLLPGETAAASLSDYYPLILSYLTIYTGALLGGVIFGFLILSDKDDGTLQAMLVTPVSPKRYVDHRIALSVVVTFSIVLFLFYAIDIRILALHEMVLISFAAAWTAPLIMLFLVILAAGKLQGLNYSKFLSLGGLLIIVSWWVAEPVQFLFGLFPPYWASRAYWTALAGDRMWVVYLLMAILYQWAAVVVLRNRFVRTVYRRL